jgi:Flp pilus assembly pilin Flp
MVATPLNGRAIAGSHRKRIQMRIDTIVGLKLLRSFREFLGDRRGQDLIEYALMAGFIAVSVVTMFDGVASSFVNVMSKVNSVVVLAGTS